MLIELGKIGQSITLNNVAENGSTGYLWNFKTLEQDIVDVDVKKVPSKSDGNFGGSLYYDVTFTVLKHGEVTFSKERPWSKEVGETITIKS